MFPSCMRLIVRCERISNRIWNRNFEGSLPFVPVGQPRRLRSFIGFRSNSPNCRRKMSSSSEPAAIVDAGRIVWVDLEMTGLDPEKDHIVEMAVIVTDSELNVVAESPDIVINHSESVIENMSDWCKENFAKSGLTEEIRTSTISLPTARQQMLEFVQQHVGKRSAPLAGSSVWCDRLFLRKHMPEFEEYLHYRIIDVSTIKELSRRWYPDLQRDQPAKTYLHRARSDIFESIEELRWYRKNVFRSS